MSIFYDRYWSKNKRAGKIYDFSLKWPKLRPYIPQEENIVIVDFGCGDGKIIKELVAINSKAKYIGLDVSEVALARASSLLPNIEFHKIVDGGKFPLADQTVDFIFSSEVIEHVYDVETAFSEIARVLKPGGRLLLTTPYHGFIKNLLIVSLAFNKHFDPTGPHIRFFSKKSLFSCLNRAGLKMISYRYYGRFYPIPCSIVVVAEKG